MLEQDGALSSVTQAEDAKWGSGIGMPSMTLPLGFHVPLALKEKIWRGEFIELGLLLEGSGAINWDNSSFGEQGMPQKLNRSALSRFFVIDGATRTRSNARAGTSGNANEAH